MMKTFRGFGRGMLLFGAWVAARLKEPTTYAGLAALCAAMHITISGDRLHLITTIGMYVGSALAIVVSEAGAKPAAQIASDVAAEILGALKANGDKPPVGPSA